MPIDASESHMHNKLIILWRQNGHLSANMSGSIPSWILSDPKNTMKSFILLWTYFKIHNELRAKLIGARSTNPL